MSGEGPVRCPQRDIPDGSELLGRRCEVLEFENAVMKGMLGVKLTCAQAQVV